MSTTVLPAPTRRRELSWAWLPGAVLLVLLGAAVLLPLGMLAATALGLGPAVAAAAGGGLAQSWDRIVHELGLGPAVWNTIALAGTYIGISMPIAVAIAWLLGRTDLPGSRWLEFGFWLSFFIPPLTIVQGYVLLLEPQSGVLNSGWHALFNAPGPFNIFSWWGIVFGHLVTTAISAKVMLITPAFRNLDGSLEEAALVAGDSVPSMLRRIVVPVLAPTLLVTLVLGVVKSLESFEIELVLGTPVRIEVYSTLMYRLIRSQQPDYQGASVLGVAIVLTMAALAVGQRRLTAGRSYTTVSGKYQRRLTRLGRWRWPLWLLVIGVLCLLVVLPLGSLLAGTFMTMYGYFNLPEPWTWQHWKDIVNDRIFAVSLANTLKLAFGAAFCSAAIGFVLGYVLNRTSGARGALLDLLTWVPFSMPGVLLSFAVLSVALTLPGLGGLYGSRALMTAAVVLGSLTLSVQLVRSSLAQLGTELEEASFVAGASRLLTLRRIVLPLVANTLSVTALMAFIAAASNVSHISLLYTSDNRPLSMMQLEYLTEGRYEAASVVGTVIVALTVAVALVARMLQFTSAPRHE
jgi:iron(III) transport system permease protein